MRYTIYIKLTNECNLKCLHCYNANASRVTASVSDVNLITDAIVGFKKSHSHDVIDVQLHGGEPMLYDIDVLHAVADRFAAAGVNTGITTNLIYDIDQRKIDFFKKVIPNGDGIPYVTTSWDEGIRFSGNQLKKWEDNVRALCRNGIVVQPIVCVTKQLLRAWRPDALMRYFESLGVFNLNFERITPNGNAELNDVRPLNSEVDAWLYDAFLQYEKDSRLGVPMFDQVIQSTKRVFLGCRARRCCSTVMTVNPDRTVALCPNTADTVVGRITDSGISVSQDICRRCSEKERAVDKRCLACKYYRYCNGDCYQLAHDESGCPGLKHIYEFLLRK